MLHALSRFFHYFDASKVLSATMKPVILLLCLQILLVAAQSGCTTTTASDGREVVDCLNPCGVGTSLSYSFLYVPATNDDYSSGVSVPCSFNCINNHYSGDCVDDFSSSSLTFDDLCQNYCGFVSSDWLTGCYYTTSATTICRRNWYAPLKITLASGQEISIAPDSGSSMLLEYPNGATTLTAENTNCYIAIGSPFSHFVELKICFSCTLYYLDSTSISYSYDCSNLLTGSCAIVNSAGECTNNAPEPVSEPTTSPLSSNYLDCYRTIVGTTLCRYNTPSPLTLNIAAGQATFGDESFLLFECADFASPSPETCECYVAIGDPSVGYDDSDYCRSCTVLSITTESARAYFDCSNVLVGNCSTVTYDFECLSNIPPPTAPVAISAPAPVYLFSPAFFASPIVAALVSSPTSPPATSAPIEPAREPTVVTSPPTSLSIVITSPPTMEPMVVTSPPTRKPIVVSLTPTREPIVITSPPTREPIVVTLSSVEEPTAVTGLPVSVAPLASRPMETTNSTNHESPCHSGGTIVPESSIHCRWILVLSAAIHFGVSTFFG